MAQGFNDFEVCCSGVEHSHCESVPEHVRVKPHFGWEQEISDMRESFRNFVRVNPLIIAPNKDKCAVAVFCDLIF
jgi:hypothetical protein